MIGILNLLGIQTTGQPQIALVLIILYFITCNSIYCTYWSRRFSDKDEARKKREEKRIQRQKEIEAKRNARQGTSSSSSSGGPLKLGGKKLGID